MNFDFYMPVRVVSGRTALADSAAQLKKLGDSCMVVTGKHSAKASGALDDLTEVLRREKISCTVYDGITENPLLFLRGSGGFGGREKGRVCGGNRRRLSFGRGEGHSRAGGQPWA